MTCIVGIKAEGKVFIGGDSAGVSGWNLYRRADVKVFQKGSFLIGFTTSYRMGQLIRYKFQPPDIKDQQDVFEYMVVDFVDALRECLKDGGFAKVENQQEEGGVFLVGFRGRLFEIDSDYHVGENLDSCAAVGSGMEYALGSLYSTRGRSPVGRIEKALDAAAYYSIGVCEPFIIEEM
jgi:ATP-dependent protease HslVU (ClpYQ) peptidase subunit